MIKKFKKWWFLRYLNKSLYAQVLYETVSELGLPSRKSSHYCNYQNFLKLGLIPKN